MYLPHELGNAIGRAARAEILLFTTYILNRFDRDNLREEGIENSSSTRLVLMFVPYTVKGDRHLFIADPIRGTMFLKLIKELCPSVKDNP